MAVYPYYDDLQKVASNMSKGNFGLWFNKLIPISNFDFCKASDKRGNENNTVSCYHDEYNRIYKDTINRFLTEKHRNQQGFCSASSSRYELVISKAKLKTPLITGIGESHPHEVSMVFDHNLGIPYIPASGIKGIVRFAHTLGLLADIPQDEMKTDINGKEYFEDEKDWTYIPQIFGTQGERGSVIFLDAYSEKVPDIHVDIMNPHYGKYYSDESPPADYLDPNPLKFLTVAKDTVFIFRALVDKKIAGLVEKVKSAFKKALTEEGVGAKTAVGYGIFELIDAKSQGVSSQKNQKEKSKQSSKEDKKAVDIVIWGNAVLSYTPNTGEITAFVGNKKALSKDKSIVSELLLNKLKEKKKKTITAKVEVEPYGNSFKLIKIIENGH